jgi:hypothetical protein
MATWTQIEAEAPDLAAAAKKVFEAHIHKTLATVRKDGSPRISGTEAKFFEGDIYLGSMPGSRKAADLQRDPRLALHCAPGDTKLVDGDAKLSGRAVQITDEDTIRRFTGTLEQEPPEEFPLFRIDITDLTLTRVSGEFIVVETWREGRGVTKVERR